MRSNSLASDEQARPSTLPDALAVARRSSWLAPISKTTVFTPARSSCRLRGCECSQRSSACAASGSTSREARSRDFIVSVRGDAGAVDVGAAVGNVVGIVIRVGGELRQCGGQLVLDDKECG